MRCGHLVPLALATVALTAVGCSDDEEASDVDDLEVAEVEELDLPFGDAYLAPNGERIATFADHQLCVYTATGARERCVDKDPVGFLDPNSVRWNPEGSRLLFTEDFYRYLHEPDIWSLDADSGELTNRTDDGVEESAIDVEESGSYIDVSPDWVDDGSTIRFLRWRPRHDVVDILEMPADGGEPDQVGVLATDSAPGMIAYSPDGERAAYVRMDDEDTAVTDLDGEHVSTLADDSTYMPAFSYDGEYVLAAPLLGGHDPNDTPPVRVMSVDDGGATELDRLEWAAWRTGGDGLAYATFDELDRQEVTLRLAAGADSEGREVSTATLLAPYREASWLPPVWSTRDTILLMREADIDASEGDERPFQYVLVHLGQE